MPEYRAPLRDMQFVLHELLEIEKHYEKLPQADGVTRETVDAMLAEIGKFSSSVLAPLNRAGDEVGCTLEGDVVTTPPGMKEAYAQYCEGGMNSIAADADYGGQGLP